MLLTIGTGLLLNPTVRKSILSNARIFNALNDDGTANPPDHSKVLRSNGDGTYTLSLNVTGEESQPVTEPEPINVLLIYDKSSSMWKYWVDDEKGNVGHLGNSLLNDNAYITGNINQNGYFPLYKCTNQQGNN